MRDWWDELAAQVGQRYRPHSPDYGVFLFREKLRRRGFHEDKALRLDPALVARAVPWAYFLRLGGHNFLHLATYQRPPRRRFAGFDENFRLYLASWIAGSEAGMDETFLMARLSPRRFSTLEAGAIDLHDAFRLAEDGQVLKAGEVTQTPTIVPCGGLRDEDVPSKGQRLGPVLP